MTEWQEDLAPKKHKRHKETCAILNTVGPIELETLFKQYPSNQSSKMNNEVLCNVSNNLHKNSFNKTINTLYYTNEESLPSVIIVLMCINRNVERGNKIEKFTDKIVKNSCTSLMSTLSMYNGAEINLLREIIPLLNCTIRYLFEYMRKHMLTFQQTSEAKKTIIINIDLIKFKVQFLSLQYEQNNAIKNASQQSPNQEMVSFFSNRLLIASSHNKCKSFEDTCLSYLTRICNFSSFAVEFFRRLALCNNSSRLTYHTKKSKDVLSIYDKYWHVRNVTHGYMLKIILRNCNIESVNIMRHMYFLLITSNTPNVTIDINLYFANSIFAAHKMNLFENWPFEFGLTEWIDGYRYILVLGEPPKLKDMQYADIDAEECKSNSSYYDNSTVMNGATVESDVGEFNPSVFYSESDLFYTKSSCSTSLHINHDLIYYASKGSIISVDVSIDDELASVNSALYLRHTCGEPDFTKKAHEQFSLYDSALQEVDFWITRLFNQRVTSKGIPNLRHNKLINETAFDMINFDIYQKSIAHLCTTIVKLLGQTIIQSLIGSISTL